MNLAASLIGEIQHENNATLAYFEAIPDDQLEFKVHEKSFTIMQCASHIVETFTWTPAMVDLDDFTLDMENYQPFVASSKQELIDALKKNLEEAIAKIQTVSDEDMMKTWTMTVGGNKVMELPRIAVLKSMLVSHQIHHRGQLSVYLRLAGASVPSAYGPTADFPAFG